MVDFGLINRLSHLRRGMADAHVAVLTPEKIGRNISASQGKTWELCRRKWAFLKLWGLKERDKDHFRVGHALHAVAERYIGRTASDWAQLFPPGWDAKIDDEAKAFVRRAAELAVTLGMWQASPDALVEFPVALLVGREFLDARGMPLVARAQTYEDEHGVRRIAKLTALYDGSPLPAGYDRLDPFVGFIDVLYLTTNPPAIYDHKTAKNRTYTLTKEKLAKDLQMLCYACLAFALRPDAPEVALRHNVFLKNEDAAHPAFMTNASVTAEQAAARWLDVIAMAEEMAVVRAAAPAKVDPEHPENRADHWMKVRGATEEGPARTKEACGAYGGCPFKPICHGHATVTSVVKRMDAPDVMALVRKPVVPATYGLNVTARVVPTFTSIPTPTSITPKDIAMPFVKPAPATPPAPLSIGTDAFIVDPDDTKVQFRARILEQLDNEELRVALWPHADIEPAWAQLPEPYVNILGKEQFSISPFVAARITGYQEALVNSGNGAGSAWKDVKGVVHETPGPLNQTPPAAVLTPAAGIAEAKVTTKPPSDGKFGLAGVTTAKPTMLTQGVQGTVGTPLPSAASKGQAVVSQAQRAAEMALVAQAPAPTFEPQVGDTVEVIASPHSYWGNLAGQTAQVTDVSMGETQPVVTVAFGDGLISPDVSVGRFKLVARAGATPPSVPPVAPAGPDNSLLPASLEDALAMKGKQVSVKLTKSATIYNAILEEVDVVGITLLSGQVKASWEEVTQLTLLRPTDVPGLKLTKEQKAAAKAEAAAAERIANRGTALDTALSAVTAALGEGGKVTKKAFEALLPLLEDAKVFQQSLLLGAPIAPQAAPSLPPLFSKAEVTNQLNAVSQEIQKALRMVAGP